MATFEPKYIEMVGMSHSHVIPRLLSTYLCYSHSPHICTGVSTSFQKNTWATKKKTSYFPLYWLINRVPYNGLL